ncbi:MAG: PIN domain-containing protein [Phycisphaeraceae bacterium]|nr:PIN domain-containing protein [Phycisphaeraceae bacterium]
MMRRPLLDINILLDVLGQREPFLADAAKVWSAVETGHITGLISADSFTTVYYLLRRASNTRTALRGMRLLQGLFEVIPVDAQIISQALDSPVRDFENAIQYHCAIRGNADCIVTRDLHDYRRAELPVLAPDAFVASLEA